VLGEKGEVLDSSKVRDGPIFAIQPVEAKKIWVYSDKGRSVVEFRDKKIQVTANKNSKFSMDMDGQFHQARAKGDFPLEEFDAKIPGRIYGSPRVMLESVGEPTEYVNVFAYATDSESYRRDLVEDNKALTYFEVVGKGHSKIRKVEMKSPVKQFFNCFSKQKESRKDAIYVLTCDDKITRFKVTELVDEAIDSDNLSRTMVYEDEGENHEMEDIGDIETFTVRADSSNANKVYFAMKDEDDLFLVVDELD